MGAKNRVGWRRGGSLGSGGSSGLMAGPGRSGPGGGAARAVGSRVCFFRSGCWPGGGARPHDRGGFGRGGPGRGFRWIARRLGRCEDTVLSWLRRFTAATALVRVVFTRLLVAVDPDPPLIGTADSPLADAVPRSWRARERSPAAGRCPWCRPGRWCPRHGIRGRSRRRGPRVSPGMWGGAAPADASRR
ncbi:MAG: hypothetical protein JWR48_621 [Mycobacterium sp.]|nr:hypothetical protein [Mycobacterium sp.]